MFFLGLLSLAPLPLMAQVSPRPTSGTTDQENRDKLQSLSKPRTSFTIDKPSQGQGDPASQAQFDIISYNIEGASTVSVALLLQATKPFTGAGRNLSDIYKASDAITKIYSDAGYALSFAIVPVQKVENGIVTIRVVEGIVDDIDVIVEAGSALVGTERIKSSIAKRFSPLVNSGPVRIEDIERALLTTSDWGGVDVNIVVKPSKTTENAASLTLNVSVKPVSGSLQADNRMRSDFGDQRYIARISLNSGLFVGDSLTIDQRIGNKVRGFKSTSINYGLPIAHSDLTANFSYSKANTRGQKGLFALLDFASAEEVVRTEFRYPLQRTRFKSLFLSAGLSAIDSKSGILGTTLIHDKIRNLDVAATWDWATESEANGVFRVGLTKGLEGLGASRIDNPLRSRTQGKPYFLALTTDLSLIKRFASSGIIMSFDASTQVSERVGALAANECSYGGQLYGKAYNPGVIGGENCFKASVELAKSFSGSKVSVQPYIFFDMGAVSQNGPLDASEVRSISASSAGLGIRLAMPFGLQGDVYAAWPSKAEFAQNGKKDARIFFTVGLRK